jgi:hypothetical protein
MARSIATAILLSLNLIFGATAAQEDPCWHSKYIHIYILYNTYTYINIYAIHIYMLYINIYIFIYIYMLMYNTQVCIYIYMAYMYVYYTYTHILYTYLNAYIIYTVHRTSQRKSDLGANFCQLQATR